MRQNLRKVMGYLLAAMLLVSLVTALYAEAPKAGGANNGPKIGNQEPKKNTPPNNIRKGDNRDDARSGKVDRLGDGNSGQGDDKKGGFKNPKNDNQKPRHHDPRTCPICRRHLPPQKEPTKRQPPQTTDKDNSGVRDNGKGEGQDDVGQGKGQGNENRKNNSLRKKWGADRREDVKDRNEDRRDKREDIKDRNEDRRDRREDIKDRNEDRRDDKNDGGKWDKREDRRDKKEDIRDRKEDIKDKREDVRDRREDRKDRREDRRDNNYPPKRKWGAGDNRDDSKSGKVDRLGDGNSGQGNDRKLPPKREGNNKPKMRPSPQGDSSANPPDKRRGDNRDDSRSGKSDRIGDGNSGQGNYKKDSRIRPPHNPRTCPICNPKLRNEGKNIKPSISKDTLGISGTVPKDNNDKGNEGVRDGGQGEGRDSAGQGKGQGDTNKGNKESTDKSKK